MKYLEICAADIRSVLAAKRGGADRVELCSGLEEGGVTPSTGLVKAAVSTGMRVHVLIRPRGGDFVYSDAEKNIMLADIRHMSELGVHAVVCGALTAEGTVDESFLADALEAAGKMEFTFHRAFDVVRDPHAALETLKKHGVNYLLTSGCARSAMEGASLIADLVKQAAGKPAVIAAAGISSANLAELSALTGCSHFHASARRVPLADNDENLLFAPSYPSDSSEVAALKAILNCRDI